MVTSHDRQQEKAAERAQAVGLFRYCLIRPLVQEGLTGRQRGVLVRVLAEAEHAGPFGDRVRVSRPTIDRWVRRWRAGGFEALVPPARRVAAYTPAAVLEVALALKRELPERTAAQIATILTETSGWSPNERTLQRLFVRLELNTRPDGKPPAAFGRFQAGAPNDLWTGDALHGPLVQGRKAILFAFIDDNSRALVGYRWAHSEDSVRLAAALRPALAARGVPHRIYVDNGSAFCDAQLLRACACLGIQLVHSRPGKPAGRGKIERVFRTIREQFLLELTAPGAEPVRDLAHLNELFTAWVEQVYHRRVHTETDQPPLQRFLAAGPPPVPTSAALREAFLWSTRRTVTKTATVSFEGNLYEVDPALVGRRVELVYDPFDLTHLQVRYDGRDMGQAIAQRIGRHVHAKARAAQAQVAPTPAATGIDYLNLVHARHTGEVADRLRYDRLPTEPAGPQPADPDPALEAELASFAALRATLRADLPTGPPAELVPADADQLDLITLLEADRAAHGGQAS